MAINVKIVDPNGNVTTKIIESDEPYPSEILAALDPSDNAVLLMEEEVLGRWDVFKCSDVNSNILITGKAPYVSDDPKRRESCDLTDEQAKGIVATVKFKL